MPVGLGTTAPTYFSRHPGIEQSNGQGGPHPPSTSWQAPTGILLRGAAVIEFLFWAILLGCLTPLARWYIIFALWDATTFRPSWDFFRVLDPEDREDIRRRQQESRSALVDWLFAGLIVELFGLGFVFGMPLGLDMRLGVCRLIGALPVGILACPPGLRWF